MSKDIPGNTIASQAAYERSLIQGAEAMMRCENALSRLWSEDIHVKGLSLKAPKQPGAEWLAVVRADVNGSASVAFVSGESYFDTVRRVAVSFENKSLKWRDDEYA